MTSYKAYPCTVNCILARRLRRRCYRRGNPFPFAPFTRSIFFRIPPVSLRGGPSGRRINPVLPSCLAIDVHPAKFLPCHCEEAPRADVAIRFSHHAFLSTYILPYASRVIARRPLGPTWQSVPLIYTLDLSPYHRFPLEYPPFSMAASQPLSLSKNSALLLVLVIRSTSCSYISC